MATDPPAGISLDTGTTPSGGGGGVGGGGTTTAGTPTTTIGDNLHNWIVRVQGPTGTLYEGEEFKLEFKFSQKYPFEAPEVRLR